jgi:hypothetical protein
VHAVGSAEFASSHVSLHAPDAPKALTTRYLDFWLLGGASLLVWLALVGLAGFRSNPGIAQHFVDLTATTASLSLLVNYPHFLLSYKLAYGRGRPFVFAHWPQLVAVPLALLALFVIAYRLYEVPVASLRLVSAVSTPLSAWGANAQVLAGPRLGDVLLTGAFNLMILTIGWHYTKQVFGCMLVYAHLDGYRLSVSQRRLLKGALLSVWAMSFVDNNLSGSFRTYGGFSYSTFDLPDLTGPISLVVVAVSCGLVLYRVFYTNYVANGQMPSLNMVVPLVALYVWWLPVTRQAEFYFLLVPLFHSLQYLAFVYKREHTRLAATTRRDARATVLIVGVVVAGWLAFEFLPGTMDARLRTPDAWGFFFFMTAVMLFINIHHYFIDNVIWRFSDPEVRANLLG